MPVIPIDCACAKVRVAAGIRQVRNGPKDWTIHDLYECYRVVAGRVVWRVRKSGWSAKEPTRCQ